MTQDLLVHLRRILAASAACLAVAATAAAQGPDLRLVDAVAERDHAAVRALLDEGVDVNARRADGVTALLWAAYSDDVEIAERLIAAGSDVDAADDHGVTPLERAAENASIQMTEMLLAAGADPNAAMTSGLTPLMTAAQTGNTGVVQALLDAGADVNATVTTTGSTALMWAIVEQHGDVIRMLLDAGTDPSVSTVKGFTPLMYAAQNGDIETARALIAAGVDINEPSTDGTYILPFSIVFHQDAFAIFLIEEGADPNGTMNGVSALHVASGDVRQWLQDWDRRHGYAGRYGRARRYSRARLGADKRLPLVHALLDRGADPNARINVSTMFMSYIGYPKKGAFEPFACGTGDLRGATPLWIAAFDMADNRRYRQTDDDEAMDQTTAQTDAGLAIMQALMDAGADQHLTTVDGTTPLMMAAGLGRSTYRPREPRGIRTRGAEMATKFLVENGGDINAVNEADYMALHGAAFRGLNEVIEYLVEQGADINARDFRGRTPYRMAEGSKQSFQFQTWPETAQLLADLGADTTLGIPGTVQERLRDTSPEDLLVDVNENEQN